MLTPFLIGILTIFFNMIIQVLAVTVLIRFLIGRRPGNGPEASVFDDMFLLTLALAVLFAGNVIQFTIWAVLFMYLGEFDVFATAFYHSVVNFSSLGYGDIVMSEQWRLLGALEAANGVLMFGLTAGTMFSVMQAVARHHHVAEDSN